MRGRLLLMNLSRQNGRPLSPWHRASAEVLLQAVHINLSLRVGHCGELVPGRDVHLAVRYHGRAELNSISWHIGCVLATVVKLRAQIVCIVGAQRRLGRRALLERYARVDHPEDAIRVPIRSDEGCCSAGVLLDARLGLSSITQLSGVDELAYASRRCCRRWSDPEIGGPVVIRRGSKDFVRIGLRRMSPRC